MDRAAEAMIFANGNWVSTVELSEELTKKIREVAEHPDCSTRRYKLTSVIFHIQEVGEGAHEQDQKGENQQVGFSEAHEDGLPDIFEMVDPAVEGPVTCNNKRKAAAMDS